MLGKINKKKVEKTKKHFQESHNNKKNKEKIKKQIIRFKN